MILQQSLAFYSAFFEYISTEVVYLQRWHGWCHMKLLPSWCVLCTPYNHVTSCKVMSLHAKPCHFMQSHIRKLHLCLTVTCHLHFWQNDRYLLYATAATQGWNGYRNKSQHRKLTLDKKILPPFLQVFEPTIFQSQVQHSNHWAIPAIQVHAERVYVSLPVTCHQHLWLNDQGGLQAASVTSWWKG